jgi:hypothetical protein
MNEIVERVMASERPIPDPLQAELCQKVFAYVELLTSAGKRDPEELVAVGAEYLRKLIHGPDSRFTGC